MEKSFHWHNTKMSYIIAAADIFTMLSDTGKDF